MIDVTYKHSVYTINKMLSVKVSAVVDNINNIKYILCFSWMLFISLKIYHNYKIFFLSSAFKICNAKAKNFKNINLAYVNQSQ